MKKLSTAFFLCLTLSLTACSSTTPKTETEPTKGSTIITTPNVTTPSDTTQNNTSSPVEKVFTLDELKKYDGQNGNLAYVAIDGVVYDATKNNRWKNGKHEGWTAGNDLSEAINSSPHGKSVLEELPTVGTLKK